MKKIQHFSTHYWGDFVLSAIDGLVLSLALIAVMQGALIDPFALFSISGAVITTFAFYTAGNRFLFAIRHPQTEHIPFFTVIISFFSFLLGGILPILFCFFTALFFPEEIIFPQFIFAMTALGTVPFFILLGSLKKNAVAVTRFQGIIETLFLGLMAAGIGYGAGMFWGFGE